jgi:peroxin-5
MLNDWIASKFPAIHAKHEGKDFQTMPVYELYDHVTSMFLEAARQDAARDVVNPDVQVGLGILFYNSGQYDKAVDCFNTALKVRPNVSAASLDYIFVYFSFLFLCFFEMDL